MIPKINVFASALLLATTASALAEVHYVDVNSTNATPPYTNWTTAATNIQDAVAAATAGDEIVVTNGIYPPLSVDKPLNVRSANGPESTTIDGRLAGRCAYLASGAGLSGFTLTHGFADYGGGVYCESQTAVVSNCVVSDNGVAYDLGGDELVGSYGGGAYGGTLNNCTLSGNLTRYGGGAAYCTLNNCSLSDNEALVEYNSSAYPPFDTYGGGAYRCTLNHCTLEGNRVANTVETSGYLFNGPQAEGGGAYDCTLNDCSLSGNWASVFSGYAHSDGGGAASCTLSNCALSYNSADSGGGAYSSALNNCTLNGNSASGPSGGGGAVGCTLSNCIVTGNQANGGYVIDVFGRLHFVPGYGGGAGASTLNNCALTGNSAGDGYGGGAASSILNNCALSGNSATYGGGTYGGTLNNCTVSGNLSTNYGGGAAAATLTNCIVYFNTANNGANYDPSSTLNYCCTTPLPTNGLGNISSDPQLASASHLSPFSPCIGKGNYAMASGADIDGQPWANPPSIGCDEYHAGAVTGPINANIIASFTNITVGYPVNFTASIEGRTDLSVWTFGDGALEIDQPSVSHSWPAPGDYLVSLWAFNDSGPGGVSVTVTIHVVAGIHYVAADSANPAAPYTSWATAATNIQDAVDAAVEPGAVVVVTNGVYATGGRVVGDTTNRLVIPGSLTVRSVNGPQFTTIDGGQSVRCAYLTNGATLSGFTLTNGLALGYYGSSGGGGVHCESANAVVSNCVVTGNSSDIGGGATGGTLNNCTLSGNSATYGAGANGGVLNNCTLSGNSAAYGGGASSCTLNNCTLTGNSGTNFGGGTYYGTLNNCTLSGNSAGGGGGAYYATLNNCITYFNTSKNGANYDSSSTLNYCCTTPQPTNGLGNISLDPQLASSSHLSADSPCRGAGSTAYASGTDIDGEPWFNPPSIGCDEFHAGAVTGPLSVGITASFTTVTMGLPVQLIGLIDGRTTASVWDFADGNTATNQPYTSHAWTALGDYAVVLRAYNESQAVGISATVTVHVVAQPVHYVAASSANPVAPYMSWATAATNIQDAVDAATVPGALVLVTNGTYATGGRAVEGTANRVVIQRFLILRSVNGPKFSAIDGGQSVRCAYLVGSTTLSGFTLTNGLGIYGGGVFCESQTAVVSNCVVSGNVASGYDSQYHVIEGSGGGAYGGTLNNCTLTGNSATGTYGTGGGASACALSNCTLSGNTAWASAYGGDGGGAYLCMLNNCILTGNSATGSYGSGGGAEGCTLNNCTLAGNSAAYAGGGADSCTLNNCINFGNHAQNYCEDCYSPGGLAGHNWIGDPLFVNTNGWANLRLQPNSPCINAGNNAYAPAGPDLDGNPRIVGGTVDIGAYEFQSPVSMISYAWLQQYGLPINSSTDTSDPDGDGVDNWHEWLAGTDPTNSLSSPAQLTITRSGVLPSGIILTWSTNALGFTLQSTTNLLSPAAWVTNSLTPVVIAGQNVATNSSTRAQRFYRLIR